MTAVVSLAPRHLVRCRGCWAPVFVADTGGHFTLLDAVPTRTTSGYIVDGETRYAPLARPANGTTPALAAHWVRCVLHMARAHHAESVQWTFRSRDEHIAGALSCHEKRHASVARHPDAHVSEHLREVDVSLGREDVGMLGAEMRLRGRDLGVADALAARQGDAAVKAFELVRHATGALPERPRSWEAASA